MPKVSVIIPVYNVEEYLRECLDSVVNQTLQDIEIICVNDGSPDNSLAILEEYAKKDERIRIIEHEKNKGLGPARNTGIDNVNGDYIFFLDSDDYVKNDVIEKLYDKITETNSDLVFSQTEAFTFLKDEETINRIKYLNEWLDCRSKKDFYINVDNFEDAICNINCVAWGKLYKKEFLIKNNIRFINGKVIHEDNGFWLKICSQFPKIGFINDIGVYYRIRENAITTEIDKKKNIHKKHKHMKLVLKDVFDYFKKYSNPILYDFFYIQIKNSSEYNRYFYTELGILFKFCWLVNDKKIIIFGIPLFREKIKGNNCKIRKILGVKIYKTNVKSVKKVRNSIRKRITAEYLDKKYVNLYINDKIKKVRFQPLKKMNTNKIIWQYWGQGIENLPDIVKICFDSVEKFNNGYKIIRLNDDNIKEYLDLPDYVYTKLQNGQFGYAHFSDLLRVCLLSTYGGIWIDATILLTGKINEEYLKQDFFSFQRTKKPLNYKIWKKFNRDYFIWDKKNKVNWLNSFIIAKKNNCIVNALKDILLEFWNKEEKMEEYFTMHYIFDSLIKFKPYKNCNKLIVSDLLPHLMQINLNEKYSDKLWEKIISKCNIHKLTYKNLENINKGSSILAHILNNDGEL